MNRLLSSINLGAVSTLFALFWPLSSHSQTGSTGSWSSICQKKVAFLFFNGVQTTPDDADKALQEFRRIHGSTSPTGENISYEYMYNYPDGFEDFVETFEQRLLEQEGLLEGRFLANVAPP